VLYRPRPLCGLLIAVALAACNSEPTAPVRESAVMVDFLAPSTSRTLVLEISGPGIAPRITRNLPVAPDSTARDSFVLPSGSGRRFVVTALDSLGIPTHRADTTVALLPSASTELAMSLRPLSTRLGIIVVFGNAMTSAPD
jgi:hypothetical protein